MGAQQGFLVEPVTVVVVGAGTSVGRAIADAFAREGDAVVTADVADEGDTGDGRVDVTSADSVSTLFERVRSEHGSTRVLVNAFAFYEPVALTEQSESSWQRTWDIGVTGLFNLVRQGAEEMSSGGVIINVAAPNTLRLDGSNTAYAGAKAALIGLTRALSLELGPRGIRVVCISPGYVGALDELGHVNFHEDVPLRRPGRPDEIADLCVFLASSYATAITGVDVTIDGGLWALNKAFSYNPPE